MLGHLDTRHSPNPQNSSPERSLPSPFHRFSSPPALRTSAPHLWNGEQNPAGRQSARHGIEHGPAQCRGRRAGPLDVAFAPATMPMFGDSSWAPGGWRGEGEDGIQRNEEIERGPKERINKEVGGSRGTSSGVICTLSVRIAKTHHKSSRNPIPHASCVFSRSCYPKTNL